jgi:hypothetical protein
MPNTFTEQTMRSTYKDDYKDSDNYSQILFNAGRALQARELTQMQTIIQKEIQRFANNVYTKDGVATQTGGITVQNWQFAKISNDANNTFDTTDNLNGVILTGSVSSIKVKVYRAVAATGTDPDTIYIQYLEDPTARSPATTFLEPARVTPGEVLSNGSNINLTVQTTNTTANPAIGSACAVEVGSSEFYVKGHFVFAPKQELIVSKYSADATADIGYKIVQDVVTVSDTDALYDNQNATPNRSSPGADRLRIRLTLAKRSSLVAGETFVYYATMFRGVMENEVTKTENYGFHDHVATRVREIHGDFITKYWKIGIAPDAKSTTNFIMRVDPGTAYIDGHRIATKQTQSLIVPRATDTIVREEDQVGVDYGNYFYFHSGVGMLDIDVCEAVNLYKGVAGQDSVIGTANIRAITEGASGTRVDGNAYDSVPAFKAHLFNINRTNFNWSLADVSSIKSVANTHYVNTVKTTNATGNAIKNAALLHEPKKNALIFDTPLRRPKNFSDVTMTFMKKYNFTASGTTHLINLTDAGESFVRASDVIIASASDFNPNGISAAISTAGNKRITFSPVVSGTAYEVIVFIKKTNSTVKSKTLTSATVTAALDSDGQGRYFLDLGQSDVYSVERIRKTNSDGSDLFTNFLFDAGNRTTHQADGKLIWSGGGLSSSTDGQVFARYKYFANSTAGSFFAVNSYDGQLDYLDVPAQKLPTGGKVSLRDAIDFRPSMNGSGAFSATDVPPLPVPSDTIIADAEYYLPRADRLVISDKSELRYITGSSSLNPKFPDIPLDCIDLYKVKLGANTLHTQDLKTTIIPRKGYTMQDINKLEQKVDRLEEMTTLSLLELNTKFLQVLDSSGVDRSKAGFFVDNFSNHSHTSIGTHVGGGGKSSIDPHAKLMRPTYSEDAIDMYYDSNHSLQLNTVKKGDFVTLDYSTVGYQSQELASNTENLAPFYVQTSIGALSISPETDNWFDTQKVGETVVGTATELDLTHALSWNNSENSWYGVDPSELDVGDAANSFVSGTSTQVTHDSLDPILIGTQATESLGEWVKVGNVTDVETLFTETVEISREREEEISRTVIDSYWQAIADGTWEDYWGDWDGHWDGVNWGAGYGVGTNFWHGDFGLGGSSYGGGGFYGWGAFDWSFEEITTDMWDVITSETRETVRTANTSTYETTRTINTENTYEGTVETTTATSTSSTVNRVASESTIRDIIGSRIVDVAVIPFMRPIRINFKAEGLRANTQYFPFFDGENVSTFCREETVYQTYGDKSYTLAQGVEDDEGTQRPTQDHSQGKTNLVANADGEIIGSFEVPNGTHMRFKTGSRTFALYDVNASDRNSAMSFAETVFTSSGVLNKTEDNVQVTRILKIVGGSTVAVETSTAIENTVWTESVVTTETATDVQSTSTTSIIAGDQSTTREHVDQTVVVDYGWGTYPVDHTTDTVTPPGGSGTPDTQPPEQVPARNRGKGNRGMQDGGARYVDPIAQTFQVLEAGGIFMPSAEVYFATKGSTSVRCEIRPAVQGKPSSTSILAFKVLKASQVNLVPAGSTNKEMLQNSTKFIFDNPLFLAPGEYSIVLIPTDNNPDYNVYVGTVGEFQLGSSTSFISQQATLGGFFKSQNGKLWEPSSDIDLCYRLNCCQFVSSGNAIFENSNVSPQALGKDPLLVDSGSNVRVMLQGHGLRAGDMTWIRGIDSATNFGNGLTGADVIGPRTVIQADNSGYTYAADANVTSRKWFGGSSVTSQRNINFDRLKPIMNLTQPSSTNITLSMKTTSQSALAGDQTRFVKDSKFSIVENNKWIEFAQPKAIYNRRTENLTGAGKLAGERSSTLQVTMATTNPFLSPVLDLEGMSLNACANLISKQDSSATIGFNVPLTYVSERSPLNGTESAKHITKVTTLTDAAVGLKILLAANRPPESDFQIYWRVASGSDPIQKMAWTIAGAEVSPQPDTNKNVFREYRYLVGGEGGTMRPFTQFQVKIVMRSTNSAKCPTFRDLRIMALAT